MWSNLTNINFHVVDNYLKKNIRWKCVYLSRLVLYIMSLVLCMIVLSDMFNKKFKVIIGVNSSSLRTCTFFTAESTELFCNTFRKALSLRMSLLFRNASSVYKEQLLFLHSTFLLSSHCDMNTFYCS